MNKLYLLCRKIHRLFLFLTVPLGLAQIFSGLLLYYPKIIIGFGFDPAAIRLFHRNLSPFFATVLLIMMLTGILMYFYLWLKQKFSRDRNGSGNKQV